MIATLVARLIALGCPPGLVKPLMVAVAVLALLLALAGLKGCYDHAVVARHDAKVEAQAAKADRVADNHAADARVADEARANTEATQIKEAVDHAKATGKDPRAAYYACIRLQQSARHRGRSSASC